MNTVIQVEMSCMMQMKESYSPFLIAKVPPGAIFSAKKAGMTITAYKSGKVMFQGTNSQNEAALWGKATSLPNTKPQKQRPVLPQGFAEKNVLGSDEVGTGDFFGPITVAACYVTREKMPLLKQLGVKDSKAMKDQEICAIAKQIIPIIPNSVLICPNPKYNEIEHQGMNQGKIKALLHNRALSNVLKRIYPEKPEAILIDQFAEKNTYYRYLTEEPEIIREDVYFATKAEGLHLAVAAASIIARYKFVEAFLEMERELGMPLTKGAGSRVDQVAAEIIKRYGLETLSKYTKQHFANTEKAKQIAKNH
ncbi:ribonuclease HIII [Listeria sp. PSOL-1]|uniref:ribonuclease HIII n=1 Tax=Listeria sp. PSOL-1 TaxID=1844999 RepID=UPI0013D53084|nr:ribonuclease HIII [Listeria sp. PSOL-1]